MAESAAANEQNEQVDMQRRAVLTSLESEFGEVVDHHVLEAVVNADFARYDDAPIKDFVPVLVAKDVRARILRRPALAGRAEV
ncbi:MAG TPA: hypothetical protein VGN59_16725 [Acidimicrobiia bacterium]|jgi:hypothetical protein